MKMVAIGVMDSGEEVASMWEDFSSQGRLPQTCGRLILSKKE
jgi:hypothetical protein